MNPRRLGDFLKSKFGLFVVFVVVLFSGLWIYGRHQTKEHDAAKLATQSARKVEIGRVRVPLDQGLESGLPQQAQSQTAAQTEKERQPLADAIKAAFVPVTHTIKIEAQ